MRASIAAMITDPPETPLSNTMPAVPDDNASILDERPRLESLVQQILDERELEPRRQVVDLISERLQEGLDLLVHVRPVQGKALETAPGPAERGDLEEDIGVLGQHPGEGVLSHGRQGEGEERGPLSFNSMPN